MLRQNRGPKRPLRVFFDGPDLERFNSESKTASTNYGNYDQLEDKSGGAELFVDYRKDETNAVLIERVVLKVRTVMWGVDGKPAYGNLEFDFSKGYCKINVELTGKAPEMYCHSENQKNLFAIDDPNAIIKRFSSKPKHGHITAPIVNLAHSLGVPQADMYLGLVGFMQASVDCAKEIECFLTKEYENEIGIDSSEVTFRLEPNDSHPGVIHRALDLLFDHEAAV